MKKILLIVSILIFSQSYQAQVFPYTLNTYQEQYHPLSEAVAITPDSPLWDDPSTGYWLVPIGFEFNIMGRTATDIAIIDPGCQVAFALGSDTTNVLCPYYADIMNADTDSLVSFIVYTTEGEPGNRICKIEWQNIGFYNEFDATGEFNLIRNFQVWIYEDTYDIEFRYGPHTVDDGTLIHDQWGSPLLFFIRDFEIATQTFVDSWSLRGEPSNPTVDVVNLFELPGLEDILLGEPADSTVYHFGTGIVSVNETQELPSFNVFPTIAREYVYTYQPLHEIVRLQVMDESGRLLLDQNLGYGNSAIDISSWSQGVYFFTFGEGPRMNTKRIIKE
ncbi:MAG: T9SS type A sorting domain-containing protein [Flavobacteriales bacterium]|nr:T9SS type A sorting domain-containing protein [Flavobacteriales bacterium]